MVYGTVLKFLLDVGYDETSNPGAHVSPSFRSKIVDINNGILKTRDPECQIVFCIKKFKNRFSGFFYLSHMQRIITSYLQCHRPHILHITSYGWSRLKGGWVQGRT